MERHDNYYPPALLLRCRVAGHKFISVFYVVPKIWFGVDGNTSATSKNKLYISTSRLKNSNGRNRFGAACSVHIWYMWWKRIVTGIRWTWYKIWGWFGKRRKRVNRVNQWCIVLCHGNFKGKELYYVEQ